MEGILTIVDNFIQVKEIVEGLQLKGEEKEVQEAKKEAADSDFEKIIGERMEVPVCNYGPDCR